MMNALAQSSSPYLKQHAHNPVDWLEWSPEVFERAKRENKLVLVSIGYSACHWCHVMERESFENVQIAALMNDRFLCIKVDREERPDVDALYMDAVQVMNGRGGWPLNCFTLPDGRPVFGGTYFPPAQWTAVLQQLSERWQTAPEKFEEYAARLTEYLQRVEKPEPKTGSGQFGAEDIAAGFIALIPLLDASLGGLAGAPKFPMPSVFEFLLAYTRLGGDERAARPLDVTLTQMARGGIFDHVGGGFARYSTDARWHVPHFEKMLYDNALLLSLYSRAAERNNEYLECAEKTFDFIVNELSAPDGGFYCAYDADSEGQEGKFYVWSHDEWISACEPEWAERMAAAFHISPQGNWEHGQNIPFRTDSDEQAARVFGVDFDDWRAAKNRSLKKLYQQRATRVKPGLDDKILAAWNGMVVAAACDFAVAHPGRRKHALDVAEKSVRYLKNVHVKNHRVWRTPKINGFADDYAFVVRAFVRFAQVCGQTEWWHSAHDLVQSCMEYFFDASTGFFFFTPSDGQALVARNYELYDNVVPSSNAVMMHNLLTLGKVFDRRDWVQIARNAAVSMRDDFHRHPATYSHWGSLMARLGFESREAVVAGADAFDVFAAVESKHRDRVLALHLSQPDDQIPVFAYRFQNKNTLYVCDQKGCLPPETNDLLAAADRLIAS